MELLIFNISVFLLCLAVLNVLREGMVFYRCYRNTEPYEAGTKRMLWLWASISFIITKIIAGI